MPYLHKYGGVVYDESIGEKVMLYIEKSLDEIESENLIISLGCCSNDTNMLEKNVLPINSRLNSIKDKLLTINRNLKKIMKHYIYRI